MGPRHCCVEQAHVSRKAAHLDEVTRLGDAEGLNERHSDPDPRAQLGRFIAMQLHRRHPQSGSRSENGVFVSIDGEDDQASEAAALGAWSADSHNPLRVITGPREGINAARNRALGEASGRWTLCINDDLYAQPDLLAQHILGHLEALDREGADARDGVIVGDAPWSVHPDDSLFDRLARETSIIFFYHRMNEPAQSRDRWKDWGFRHYYTLNASAPTRELCEIGGFAIFPVVYGYDDLEAAWRLKERFGTPIYYRPGAKGTHDHRYTPDEYLRREHTLGRAAWCLALASPGCAYDMFGRDITTPGELDYSREFVERERTTAARLRESFLEMGRIPSSAISGPASSKLIGLLYEQHLLLKRW